MRLTPLITLLATFTVVHALEIDAPPEIAEQIREYAMEVAPAHENAILKVSIAKNVFELQLIDKAGKNAIKESKTNSSDLPNSALQNAVHKLFGRPVKSKEAELNGNAKTALAGAGFVATAILFYFSNQPKPVRGEGASVNAN